MREDNVMFKRIIFATATVCAILFIGVISGRDAALPENNEISHARAENPFASLELKAKAAFVFDVQKEQTLFALNGHAQLPLASLTKIMTSLLAFEESRNASSIVTVTKEAVAQEGDHGLRAGEQWRLKDLIDVTLTASSNDGAYALASVIQSQGDEAASPQEQFVQKMNKKARELSLAETFFISPVGLDFNEGVSGSYGSASDIARLVSYVIENYPEIFEATTYARLTSFSLDGKAHNLENTNKTVESLPGVIASKTGFTDLAGGNLAIAFEAGPVRPVVIVVLGSTAEDRFIDAEKLLWASLRYLEVGSYPPKADPPLAEKLEVRRFEEKEGNTD